MSQQVGKRNSLLCNTFASITLSTTKLSKIFENINEIQLCKSLGPNQLAKRTMEKGALFTQATKLAIDLKQDVENKYLLSALRRKLSQMNAAQYTYDINIESKYLHMGRCILQTS